MKNKKAKVEEEVYRLDIEKPVREGGPCSPILNWEMIEHFTGPETNCKWEAENMKASGFGGRLVRLDGTPDGELVEQWASIGRLEWAATQELSVKK